MKQKKNNKTLLILLVIVVILIGALELYERYGEIKMRENLTDVNLAKITRIALSNEKADQYISLRKEESGWFITADKVQIPVENQSVNAIHKLLKELRPIKIVSSNKEDWEKYGTTDEQGLRVTTYHEKEILSDIFIGKIEKNDIDTQLITYVRLKGDQEIYSVKGDLRKCFAQDFFEQIFPKDKNN